MATTLVAPKDAPSRAARRGPGTRLDQAMDALGKANDVRIARAAFKRSFDRLDPAAGLELMADVLEDPPDILLTIWTDELLRSCRFIGPDRARALLADAAGAHSRRRLGNLTLRQRKALSRELRAKRSDLEQRRPLPANPLSDVATYPSKDGRRRVRIALTYKATNDSLEMWTIVDQLRGDLRFVDGYDDPDQAAVVTAAQRYAIQAGGNGGGLHWDEQVEAA